MLKTLSIKNLAVIDALDIDFSRGYTALTGETGAGKSILIDAIGLVIGLRADAGLVRAGCDRAEITASFELELKTPASRWLAEQDLLDADDAQQLIIRRVVFAEGRTRAFINGTPINAAPLRELGERLVDIFGQSESQTLLRAATQREILDDYGVSAAARSRVADAASACADAEAALDALRRAGERDPAQLEFLRFQLAELDALALGDDELDSLEAEHRQLAHAGRLLSEGAQAQELLYGGEASVYDQLSSVQGLLEGLVPLHEGFRSALDAVESAQAQVRDAADSARRVLDRLDLDPQRLVDLERRLGAIHDVARKHRIKPTELPARQAALRNEVDAAGSSAERIAVLERERETTLARYREAAAALSQERRRAAKKLGSAVSERVRPLGMPNAQFLVEIETDADVAPRSVGADSVRFDFSANPGQPPRPLARVASGGELSRVSLALQVAALARGGAPTMIFDEVDAGISGAVAEVVGQQLRALGAQRQVFSVTHLAQVAAQAHAHFGIRKQVRNQQTYTQVEALDAEARVQELARMQGGAEISKAALAHARDLLERAGSTA